MNTLLTAAAVHGPTVLAVDPAEVKPGWLALVIILLIGLATYLLWRSMNRQLKKVDFDDGVDRSQDHLGRVRRTPRADPPDESEPSRPGPDRPVSDGDGGTSPS